MIVLSGLPFAWPVVLLVGLVALVSWSVHHHGLRRVVGLCRSFAACPRESP